MAAASPITSPIQGARLAAFSSTMAREKKAEVLMSTPVMV